jgi:MOSC domain-containing protein YiiM
MSDGVPGRLIGIAVRSGYRAPMQTRDSALITIAAGVEGDYRGAKYPRRAVTVLSREGWEAALAALGTPGSDWTARRANLLVEGAALPRAAGGVVRIGPVVLEVTGQTSPCSRMEEVRPGLLRALYPDWRGGITCRVVEEGRIALGDPVEILVSPPERKIKLPG